jgi:hypothetical protein
LYSNVETRNTLRARIVSVRDPGVTGFSGLIDAAVNSVTFGTVSSGAFTLTREFV